MRNLFKSFHKVRIPDKNEIDSKVKTHPYSMPIDKKLMIKWAEHREGCKEDVLKMTNFSLNYMPMEEGYFNSRVHIYADGELYAYQLDMQFISSFIGKKPDLTFDYYPEEDKIFFYSVNFMEGQIKTLICHSVDGDTLWYKDKLADVETTFVKPRYRIINQ